MTYYCPDCDRHFHSGRKARDQHCLATGHALPQFDCDTCSFCFDDEYDRCEHMNHDPAGVIVNKRLEWHGERTYEINPRLAWNHWAKAYECYLCHKLHSSLHGLKLHGLKLHVESPKHQQKLYHCLNPTCRKEFATLAALINHLESESCKILRFQQAQRGISSIVDPNQMISN